MFLNICSGVFWGFPRYFLMCSECLLGFIGVSAVILRVSLGFLGSLRDFPGFSRSSESLYGFIGLFLVAFYRCIDFCYVFIDLNLLSRYP